MNCATLPALSFGIFDHLDHAGGSLRQQYSDRLEIAAACDEAGFRAYHVAEHHGTPHGLAASPNLFLSAVAQRTRKLRLGPLVMLLNLYHPLRAFEEICMLDQLSGGRLDLGIGRGAVPLELSFFGVSPSEAQDHYSEAAEIVLKAMETDTLTYCGRHFSISDVPITLSPIQKPYPPLWYGTTKPETADGLRRIRSTLLVSERATRSGQLRTRTGHTGQRGQRKLCRCLAWFALS
jgi:alkanesulfonate monooxygenase SsuD/methylene tetrahydromethanopterin reductase-like flavin-dependent oxidoreductase (luciferase family)